MNSLITHHKIILDFQTSVVWILAVRSIKDLIKWTDETQKVYLLVKTDAKSFYFDFPVTECTFLSDAKHFYFDFQLLNVLDFIKQTLEEEFIVLDFLLSLRRK